MNRYPTDEELKKIIEQMEMQELYAPKHLKEQIVLKVKESERSEVGSNHQVSFLVYTFKMVAGMAAALFLIFAIPASNGSDLSYATFLEEKSNMSREILQKEENRQAKERVRRHLEDSKNKVLQFSDEVENVFNTLLQRKEFGGYENED